MATTGYDRVKKRRERIARGELKRIEFILPLDSHEKLEAISRHYQMNKTELLLRYIEGEWAALFPVQEPPAKSVSRIQIPPPPFSEKTISMKKRYHGVYDILALDQFIGIVSRRSDGTWSAQGKGEDAPSATRPTRKKAVSALLKILQTP